MKEFDLIIIGCGPGGYPAAAAAASDGLNVAIVERDELGGTCLNRGCIPTKCLCRTADVMLTAREAAHFGIVAPNPTVDYPAAVERKNNVINDLRQGVESVLQNVTIIRGEARFCDHNLIEVNLEHYTAPKFIVATGARPAMLPIEGAEMALTSDEILAMTELPASLVVIGGGVIGLEFASIFNALGVAVTVVEYCPEILPNFDAEVAKRLRMALKRRGIEFNLGAAVKAIRPGGTVVFDQKGKEKEVQGEQVLMAVGRRAVVPEGLDCELNRGAIKVNPETFETSIPGIYAIGDVNGLCQLAHAATAQGLRVVGRDVDLAPVPAAVFTFPEAATVGITEDAARAQGYDLRIGKSTFRSNGKALAMGETDGMVKVVIDNATDLILGASIVGPHAADLIHELSTAMAAGITARRVAAAVHAHPTLAEVLPAALA
ncbi:MAG: dihydrolipoyl dehydrogenase [Muribaculaceae bacterium]|nr:dihydrolipoyl dehydrogenase [Muribaculaceae bacterium]